MYELEWHFSSLGDFFFNSSPFWSLNEELYEWEIQNSLSLLYDKFKTKFNGGISLKYTHKVSRKVSLYNPEVYLTIEYIFTEESSTIFNALYIECTFKKPRGKKPVV